MIPMTLRLVFPPWRGVAFRLIQWFWGEAMLTACYLLNRVPNKRNKITPYELWTKKKPNLNYLRIWGCRAVVRLHDLKLKTLGERAIECIFVGYAEHSKAFRFYVIEPNESVSINSISVSRDAIFDENRFSSVPRPSQRSLVNGTEDSGGSVVPEKVTYEMDSIMGNNTWVLVDLPPGCKPLGCKWIFKRKLKVDGTVEKFKASLIIHQMDVKTTFLNGELDEEVPKQWHQKFNEVVLSNGYLLNQADKCVYRKFDESGKGVIICLYVDDMLIFGTDQVQVDLAKEFLSSRFFMKYMGEADVILDKNCTPMDTSEKLMPNNGEAVSQLEYSRVIGCLVYAMTYTRLDIAFVVGKLSRYTSNPGTQHWQAIQRSTSGWVFFLGGGAISWDSKKQTCIIGSIIESEFVALTAADKEAEFATTLAKAYSQMYNRKSRHLGVRHSMICELITNGVVSLEFVRSQQNLVYHLTKGLARDLVIKSAEGMRLNGLKHMYLHIILRMCLEPAEKEDEVVNFLMVNLFEKLLSKSMNKEEPPMVQFIPDNGAGDNMEEAVQALLTSAQINGSVHLDLDLEYDGDDMMIDAPSVRDFDQPPKHQVDVRNVRPRLSANFPNADNASSVGVTLISGSVPHVPQFRPSLCASCNIRRETSKPVAADPLEDARSKVQEQIGKEFFAVMGSETIRASEAAAVTTKKVTQKYGHMNAAQS
ncbi:zinc finger, CCHC-type containing protein [Tanacetum coccineum]